ncbi:MAG: CTP synthase [Candidatus Dependentiae bacterium]|nr:CTP synthase [Candidatus Dependentiae bacterium]
MKEFSTRFIVVAGGVISGVGKGVATASIGIILKEHGYSVTLIKVDPYINYDAGTLRPTEHGEVWVTHDGGEIDQDLGTYERFMNEDIPKQNSITTGQIYKTVIDKERNGDYLGQTVQFMPHITDEITARIKQAASGYEIAVVEIGGTVGDYENMPFLFAFKALKRELGADHVVSCLVTYIPMPEHIGEMKTKPTQQAVRMLSEQGIFPDFIICRSKEPLDQVRKKKIETAVAIHADAIIDAPDIDLIYDVPLNFEAQNFGQKILHYFKLPSKKEPDWHVWRGYIAGIKKPERAIRIAIVGKYVHSGAFSLTDSYLSIGNALMHAGAHMSTQIKIDWIDATVFETDPQQLKQLNDVDGLIIPGGFGAGGVEGKIAAIAYARKHTIPFLGICYGMQLAAVEYARSVCGLVGAHTTEVDEQTPHPIIVLLPIQQQFLAQHKYGGTMRLGACSALVKRGSVVHSLYAHQIKDGFISERHRHRYEVNPAYVAQLEKAGLVFSASHTRIDGTQLMEFIEIPEHRFFVATQAHPEFTSRLANPNPLFTGFVRAALKYADEKHEWAHDFGFVGGHAYKQASQ